MAHHLDLYTYTRTYSCITGTTPVAEILLTLYPPSTQTKPILWHTEHRRVTVTETLLWFSFTEQISATDADFPLLSVWVNNRTPENKSATPVNDLPTSWRRQPHNMEYRTTKKITWNPGRKEAVFTPSRLPAICNDRRKREELTTARGWISSSLEELDSPLTPWGWEKKIVR